MSYKKKYTPEMVLGAIEKYNDSVMSWQIAEVIGSSKKTADRILSELLKSEQITRENKGPAGKSVWIYSRGGNDR